MELLIRHTTDMHGSGKILEQIQKIHDPALLLDSGDCIHGSGFSMSTQEPILKSMNQAGYIAATLGNREFSYFPRQMKKRLSQANFPFLSLNLEDLRGNFKTILKKYIALTHNSLKIIITGLTPIQYGKNSILSLVNGLQFKGYVEAIKELTQTDEVKNADLTILLSHASLHDDIDIAKACPEISIILGGHSHIRFEEPIVVNGVYISQSGCHGRSFSEYTLTLKDRKLADVKMKNYNLEERA